ncbi:MAG: helix-turn-helix domain-containing protein [Pseudonocardiaceae bacterium]
MTPDVTHYDDLLDRVRGLRAAGRSPKEIARALGMRPAAVAPLVRTIAAEAMVADPEPAVVGCWTNPGWSTGLTVDGHEEWPDITTANHAASGLVGVVVARRHRPQRVSVCGYLVDVYCLGVKDTLGPRVMNERDLPAFLRNFFSGFEDARTPLEVPLDLARHLVWGAVDYARQLGFEPARDFKPAAGHLGPWEETSDITFGRDGAPLYVQGPHDDPGKVFRTLSRSVGDGNYHYIATAGATAGW